MTTIRLYFDDLNDSAKKYYLKAIGATEDDINKEFPICVFEVEDKKPYELHYLFYDTTVKEWVRCTYEYENEEDVFSAAARLILNEKFNNGFKFDYIKYDKEYFVRKKGEIGNIITFVEENSGDVIWSNEYKFNI